MLTKRPSLFSNERFKGMLSRGGGGNTAPPPLSPPQEKQGGGFKQVVAAPLSPVAPVAVNGAETPNADVSPPTTTTIVQHHPDAKLPQGDTEMEMGSAEHPPPPTPAKEEEAAMPVAVGASE